MMQDAERHDDIETAVMEREVVAASIVQDGSECPSVFAEFVKRLYALNPKFRASLFKESDGAASSGSDVQNALRPDNTKQRCHVLQRDEVRVTWLDMNRFVDRGSLGVMVLLTLRHVVNSSPAFPSTKRAER